LVLLLVVVLVSVARRDGAAGSEKEGELAAARRVARATLSADDAQDMGARQTATARKTGDGVRMWLVHLLDLGRGLLVDSG
jgi:hypothetical protein